MHLSFSKVGSNSPLLNNGAMIDQEKSTQLKVLKPKSRFLAPYLVLMLGFPDTLRLGSEGQSELENND